MSLPLRRVSAVTVGAAMCAALTVGVVVRAAPSRAATAGREMKLTFEGGRIRRNSGRAVLDVTRVSENGGLIRTVPDRDGAGSAARFPGYRASDPPEAALVVVDREGADDLDPRSSAFRYGAQFSLDSESWGSRSDNGNNLVQRGLFAATTQYKLQIDYAHPECRVKGRSGVVTVRSTRTVAPRTWYRATCTRRGRSVRLTVTRLDDGTRWNYRRSGATGSMTPASRSVPLSVGGKVSPKGTLVAKSADQFNGVVDNAFLNVF